jgi:transposase
MPCRESNPGKCPTSFGRGLNRYCQRTILVSGDDENTGGELAAVAGASRRAMFLPRSYMCCARGVSGKRYPRCLAAPVPSIRTSSAGGSRDFLFACGEPDWRSTTKWKGLLGSGKAWTGRREKPRWPKRRSEITRQIGGKKGTKRSLLVDGRGAPLSLIVAGANRHDVKLLAQTLDAIMVPRPRPTKRRPQNLCVDKGYAGKPAEKQMRERGYIPHVPVKGMPQVRHKRKGRARRWVVERTHSWMNNYRKLRVRYEKKASNFEALLHLAIAIICWRM